MAVVWGPKTDGTTGAMTEEDVVAFASAKTMWQATPQVAKAFRNFANYMFNHTGAGGGTVHHFDGKMIFHATESRGEATLFFTNADGQIASIVGIGEHSGKNSQTKTYKLVWKTNRWTPRDGKGNPTNTITL